MNRKRAGRGMRPAPDPDENERIFAAFREFNELPVDATEADVDRIIAKYRLNHRLSK